MADLLLRLERWAVEIRHHTSRGAFVQAARLPFAAGDRENPPLGERHGTAGLQEDPGAFPDLNYIARCKAFSGVISPSARAAVHRLIW